MSPTPAACRWAVALVVLDGCATAPAPVSAVQVAPDRGPGRSAVYVAASTAARQAGAAGRLREALWRWRIAEAVAPDGLAAHEATEAQARLDAAAQASEAEGAQALRSGHPAQAQAALLRALKLDPQRPKARSLMRDMLAAQVMADVGRLAGTTPRGQPVGARKPRRAAAPRRSRPRSS